MKKRALVICALALIMVTLSGCIVLPALPENSDNGDSNTEKSLKLDDTKAWVYKAEYSNDISEKSYMTEYSQIFYFDDISVPFININSRDAEDANAEFKRIYNDAISVFKQGLEDRIIFVDECGYRAQIFGDSVASVVVTYGIGGTDIVYPDYYAYNFNLETGKLMTLEEICDYAETDPRNIADDMPDIIANELYLSFSNNYERDQLESYVDESIAAFEKAFSEGTVRCFLDEDADVNVIITLYFPAGRGYKDIIILFT